MNFTAEEFRATLDAIEFHAKTLNSSMETDDLSAADKSSCEERLTILGRLMNKMSGEAKAFAADIAPQYDKLHVLVADDSEAIRQHSMQILQRHGCSKINQTADGHEAIARIKGKAIPYDLILCDMNMPTISGLDLLKLLRKEKDYGEVPFIMITSEVSRGLILEAIKAGINDFFAKPVEEEKLMGKLRNLLDKAGK